MANPIILYSDPTPLAYGHVLGVSTASDNPSYPLTNLNDVEPSTQWKSATACNGSVTHYLTIDTYSTSAKTGIVIDNSNIVLMSSVVLLCGDDVNFSVGYTNLGSLTNAAIGKSNGDAIHLSFPSTTKRWFGISFADDDGIYPEVGNIMIANELEFSTPYDFGYKKENTSSEVYQHTSLDGTIRTTRAYAGRILYELQFSLQSDTLRTAFQAFVNTVKGKLNPFYFVDADGTVRYMHMEDYIPVSTSHYGRHDIASLVMSSHEAIY
jgi:hypothetical protein